MRVADRRSIFNSIRQDQAERAQSGPGAADSWPAWTDEVRFGLVPEPLDVRPQLAADPSPRRAGKRGGR